MLWCAYVHVAVRVHELLLRVLTYVLGVGGEGLKDEG